MAILGDNTQGAGSFPCSDGRALASRFTTGANGGTLNFGAAYFASDSTSGTNGKICLFSDSGGLPGSLLASSAGAAIPNGGGSVNLGAMSGSLSPTTNYWIICVTDNFTANLSQDLGAVTPQAQMANGTFDYTTPPSSWPGSDASYDVTFNVWVDYTESGGGIEADASDTVTFSDSAVSVTERISLASDTITFSDSGVSFTERLSSASDTLTFSDSAVSVTERPSTASDTISFSDSAEAVTGFPAAASDSITFSDEAAAITARLSEASDTITFSDSALSTTERLSVASDTLTLSDSADAVVTYPSVGIDSVSFSDEAVASVVPAGESFAEDTITFSDSASSFSTLLAVASDTIIFSDSASVFGGGIGPVEGIGVEGLYKVQGPGVEGTGVPGVLQ